MFLILAQATQIDTSGLKDSYGNLIFMGLFFLALIVAAVWWLKRQT